MSRPFFFFQAEDGIRDLTVTGVQTCALPISLGMGAVRDSQLGSVTERFVRRVERDTLVVRNPNAVDDGQGAIVVGLDGSPQSFHGLKIGLALSKALGRPVQDRKSVV